MIASRHGEATFSEDATPAAAGRMALAVILRDGFLGSLHESALNV
jgi:hypothetical protein